MPEVDRILSKRYRRAQQLLDKVASVALVLLIAAPAVALASRLTGGLPDPRVGCYEPPDAWYATDRAITLLSCCPWIERSSDRRILGSAEVLAEFDHSAEELYLAQCLNCYLERQWVCGEDGGCDMQRVCAASPFLYVGEVDGVPLPEPGRVTSLAIGATLLATFKRRRR